MSKEGRFFIYLIERYAQYKGRLTSSVLRQWDELGLTDLIFQMYERYHSERIQNAFDDIDELIEEKSKSTPVIR